MSFLLLVFSLMSSSMSCSFSVQFFHLFNYAYFKVFYYFNGIVNGIVSLISFFFSFHTEIIPWTININVNIWKHNQFLCVDFVSCNLTEYIYLFQMYLNFQMYLDFLKKYLDFLCI